MKKTVCYLIIILGLFIPTIVNAYEYNQDIDMTEEEYENLVNLGFTDDEIYLMGEDEFFDNKDLIGEVVSTTTQYYAVITNLMTGDSMTVDLTEEQYDTGIEIAVPRGNAFIETTYKRMEMYITSINDKYRFKVTLDWKVMPANRSIDIIAIGFHSTQVYIYS